MTDPLHPASAVPGAVAGVTRAPIAELVTILLEPGADLHDGLLAGLREAGVRRATVVSGIGALARTTARNVRHPVDAFPITDADRAFVTVPGPCEMVSLTGWLAPLASGEPHLHLHFAASYVDPGAGEDAVRLIGGHVSPGACEAYVHVAVTFAAHAAIDAEVLHDADLRVERLSVPAGGG